MGRYKTVLPGASRLQLTSFRQGCWSRVEFELPVWGDNDNVKCDGQTIPVGDQVISVHLLAAADDTRGE
jgi:hypothetical protein